MDKALKTIKVYIEAEDEALINLRSANEGISKQFQYGEAVKMYAEAIRKKEAKNDL